MSCGIYQILNTLTGKSYVGSSKNISQRWFTHKKNLLKNSHHSIKLQRSWNKHGSAVWEWNILQECEEDKLIWLEAFWIARLDSYHSGYNTALLTFENGRVTKKYSEETRRKMNKPKSEEHKAKMLNDGRKGRKHTEEAKAKMRSRTVSEEVKKKIGAKSLGRVFSEESKKKMGDSRRGKKHKEETKDKLRGQKRNIETKTRMRKAKVGKKPNISFEGYTHTDVAKAKMRKPKSEEHKAKLREAWALKKKQKLEEKP